MRELARLALSDEWTMAGGIALLGNNPAEAAIAAYDASLASLADTDPTLSGEAARALRDWLKPIGMKIAPTMAPDVCSTWLTSVVMALSDFPPKVATQAARNAIHIPMQFLNEVDGHVRAEAERLMDRHRHALSRLRWMRDEIERAARPPVPMIEAPRADEPMTDAEIRALSPILRRIGLGQGWITQEQLDAADAALAA